ncbi:ATP-binding protein [Halosquirtibacter xylanolyticus]|uniref:ATP-binding protein n=1 Tax=Halosquirtibacter xylanolyticus TaxID=3374599 RepID=UPI0037489195|nr:ATP-binding protein [Prolixibacteraceae bacterium]
MRSLNKIVFINSANIPYAEIPLDGNTHFIGTQGVGKSTILRAILFFYNADSRKLGMPQGPTVKNFVQWYLSYANSYIVYEVVRETGNYCVVALRNKNKVRFRFIDSPYRSDLFMDEDRRACTSWEAIRKNLDAHQIHCSNLIQSFEEYRNIIYGNLLGKPEYKRYTLLESKQYSNIFRTIQNVFLNTKLDANEIKQTIISSMEESSLSIDLSVYANHLKGFETQINDIRNFKKESTQRYAKQIASHLSSIHVLTQEEKRLFVQLKGRMSQIEIAEPLLIRELERLNHEKQKLEREWLDNKASMEKELDALKAEASLNQEKIDRSHKQKAYYETKNIEQILERIAKKGDVESQKSALVREKQILSSQYANIQHRYEALIEAKVNEKSQRLLEKQTQINEIDTAFNATQNSNLMAQNQAIEKVDREAEKRLLEQQEQLDHRHENLHRLEGEKRLLKHTPLYRDELIEMDRAKEQKHLDMEGLSQKIQHDKAQIKTLESQWELEKEKFKNNFTLSEERLRLRATTCQEAFALVEQKITVFDRSLYGWLDKHEKQWKSNIGKVMDPQLLFRDDLAPSHTSESNSLYGVELDLTPLEDYNKDSKEQLAFEQERLQQEQVDIQSEFKALDNQHKEAVEKLKGRYTRKIKTLKEAVRQNDYQQKECQKDLDKLIVMRNELAEKAEKEQVERVATIQEKIDRARIDVTTCKESLQMMKGAVKRDKEEVKQQFQKQLKQELEKAQQGKELLQKSIAQFEETFSKEHDALIQQRNQELKEEGADTERLTQLEALIVSLEKELLFIDRHRELVGEYHKDKRELFDLMPHFEKELARIEGELKRLHQEFQIAYRKSQHQIEIVTKESKKSQEELQLFRVDKERYNTFLKSHIYEDLKVETEGMEIESTHRTASVIMDEINEKHYRKKDILDMLRAACDKFLSFFSMGNIFQFPEKLLENRAYLDWAEELTEFVEDHKIEEFERRTGERFGEIVKNVGKEITLLISKTGEIRKVIHKINTDFRSKNFVTAIQNIELGINDSQNPVVTILRNIKDLSDTFASPLGENNLFAHNENQHSEQDAVGLLKQLIKTIHQSKSDYIYLTDIFELNFRIEENGNDTGWVEKLSNVGSEGTDVLAKAMINIMLLNVFKEGASRKFSNFKLHCMMDEIGKLHPNNIKGILKFANDRNILLINGSPTESTPLSYRHIYHVSKDENKKTKVVRLVSGSHHQTNVADENNT